MFKSKYRLNFKAIIFGGLFDFFLSAIVSGIIGTYILYHFDLVGTGMGFEDLSYSARSILAMPEYYVVAMSFLALCSVCGGCLASYIAKERAYTHAAFATYLNIISIIILISQSEFKDVSDVIIAIVFYFLTLFLYLLGAKMYTILK